MLESSEESRSAELAQSHLEVEALRADKERLKKKYADLEESSRKESLRVYDLWGKKVRQAKADCLALFEPRLEKMRQYIEDEIRVNPIIMLLNQATAVHDSYTSLAEIGVSVPSEFLEKCRSDIESFRRKLDDQDVVTVDELDLDFKSLQDRVSEMDSGSVAQYLRP